MPHCAGLLVCTARSTRPRRRAIVAAAGCGWGTESLRAGRAGGTTTSSISGDHPVPPHLRRAPEAAAALLRAEPATRAASTARWVCWTCCNRTSALAASQPEAHCPLEVQDADTCGRRGDIASHKRRLIACADRTGSVPAHRHPQIGPLCLRVHYGHKLNPRPTSGGRPAMVVNASATAIALEGGGMGLHKERTTHAIDVLAERSRGLSHRHGRDENRHLKMADARNGSLHPSRHARRRKSWPILERAFKALERDRRTPATTKSLQCRLIRKKACIAHLLTARGQYRSRWTLRLEEGRGPMQARTNKWVTAGRVGALRPCWRRSSCRRTPRQDSFQSSRAKLVASVSWRRRNKLLPPMPLVMLCEGTGVAETTAVPIGHRDRVRGACRTLGRLRVEVALHAQQMRRHAVRRLINHARALDSSSAR